MPRFPSRMQWPCRPSVAMGHQAAETCCCAAYPLIRRGSCSTRIKRAKKPRNSSFTQSPVRCFHGSAFSARSERPAKWSWWTRPRPMRTSPLGQGEARSGHGPQINPSPSRVDRRSKHDGPRPKQHSRANRCLVHRTGVAIASWRPSSNFGKGGNSGCTIAFVIAATMKVGRSSAWPHEGLVRRPRDNGVRAVFHEPRRNVIHQALSPPVPHVPPQIHSDRLRFVFAVTIVSRQIAAHR